MTWLKYTFILSTMTKYARIVLQKTGYKQLKNSWKIFSSFDSDLIDKLNEIYIKYCRYKKFDSVMPMFYGEWCNTNNNVIGYYDDKCLVAFSLIRIHDDQNVECVQFAWDYENPKLRLGIKSLKHECAFYRDRQFKYMYLGEVQEYKKHFEGYEELGPI